MQTYLDFEKPVAELENRLNDLRKVADAGDTDQTEAADPAQHGARTNGRQGAQRQQEDADRDRRVEVADGKVELAVQAGLDLAGEERRGRGKHRVVAGFADHQLGFQHVV